MADPDKALATQLANIETRTGRMEVRLTGIEDVDPRLAARIRAACDAAG